MDIYVSLQPGDTPLLVLSVACVFHASAGGTGQALGNDRIAINPGFPGIPLIPGAGSGTLLLNGSMYIPQASLQNPADRDVDRQTDMSLSVALQQAPFQGALDLVCLSSRSSGGGRTRTTEYPLLRLPCELLIASV